MTGETPQDENIGEAFRNLGKNIVDIFRAAWESPEKQNIQKELENGLNELGSSIKKEIDELSASPTGQQIKSDVESLKDRIRSGETEAKVRGEVLNALHIVNTELERISQDFANRKSTSGSEPTTPEDASPDQSPPG